MTGEKRPAISTDTFRRLVRGSDRYWHLRAALLDLGDVDGQRVWKAVLRAVEELIRTERRSGERVN
jgi:hypothetical protein